MDLNRYILHWLSSCICFSISCSGSDPWILMLYPYCIWKETLMSTMEGDAENSARPSLWISRALGLRGNSSSRVEPQILKAGSRVPNELSHNDMCGSLHHDLPSIPKFITLLQILNGYFVHYFAPTDLPPLPKNVVFVLDSSASMVGTKLRQVRSLHVLWAGWLYGCKKLVSGFISPGGFFSKIFAMSEVKRGSEDTSRQDNLPAMRNYHVNGTGMGTRSAEDFIALHKRPVLSKLNREDCAGQFCSGQFEERQNREDSQQSAFGRPLYPA